MLCLPKRDLYSNEKIRAIRFYDPRRCRKFFPAFAGALHSPRDKKIATDNDGEMREAGAKWKRDEREGDPVNICGPSETVIGVEKRKSTSADSSIEASRERDAPETISGGSAVSARRVDRLITRAPERSRQFHGWKGWQHFCCRE